MTNGWHGQNELCLKGSAYNPAMRLSCGWPWDYKYEPRWKHGTLSLHSIAQAFAARSYFS